MKVTEIERKESTKHCCGNGCLWRDSAEHEEETEALIDKRITENNTSQFQKGVLADSIQPYIENSPLKPTA